MANFKEKLSKYVVDGSIDTYKVLVDNYPNLRVRVDQGFKMRVRKRILEKYGSLMNLARTEGFPHIERFYYTVISYWFRRRNGSAIPVSPLLEICELLKLSNEDVLENIKTWSKRPGKPVAIPRFIKIDYGLLYAMGLYLAEGKNDVRWKTRTAISNTDFNICNFTVRWFEKYLGIEKCKLKFYSNIPAAADGRAETLKLAKEFSVNMGQVFTCNSELCKLVDVAVSFDSKPLRLLVDWMKENLIVWALTNKELGVAFAQGVLDGEGHIRHDSAEIVLEMKNDLVLDAVELIYRNLRVVPNRGKGGQVLVVQARDFDKLSKCGAFRFCTKRKNRFEEAHKDIKLKVTRRGHALVKLLRILASYEDHATAKALTAASKYKHISNVNFLMKRATDLGYVTRTGAGSGNDPFRYKMAPEGSKYIKTKDDLDKQRYARLAQSVCTELDEKWE